MRTNLEYIIKDLKECFDGKPWYGDSVMKKLDGIDWRVVNDKVYGEKTIAVLLQHMINWRIFVLKKLEGDVAYDIIIDQLNDWTVTTVNNEQEWQALLNMIRSNQEKILKHLVKCDDDLLNETVPGKKYKFGPILRSLHQHDIYHLGQIAMLNSMAKS